MDSFAIQESGLKVVGIPRHDKTWIEYLSSKVNETLDWDGFIFLISRPASPYLPLSRKEKALIDMKRLFIDEMGMKIIVKRHPKEPDEGLFEKVFGMENIGKPGD